jgi:hypothetical protein
MRNRAWSTGLVGVRLLGVGLVGVGLVVAAANWGRVWAEEPGDLSAHFGFLPVELFKLQERSQNLIVGDFTHDNRLDLALVDNSNNRLDLLVQRDKPDPAAKVERKINQFENDWRFEHRKLPVDKAVASLASGDFNGDGLRDLVALAPPDQIQIRRQTAKGDFAIAQRFRLPELQIQMWSVAGGDLNADGKDDLIVLGKTTTYLLYQDANGELAAPVKLMNTSDSLGLLQLADLDGDTRLDVCYLISDDSDRPFAARLQGPDGKLGAEIRCELPKPRGVTLADADGLPGSEVIAIEAQTGRVKVHQLQRPHADPEELSGQLIQYGFGAPGAGKGRDVVFADVDGDGRTDVLVTDPEGAQVMLFQQHAGQGLDLGTTFPSLQYGDQARVGDVDGDKRPEVVILSTREKVLGISRMDAGRLSFPQAATGAALANANLTLVAFDLVDLNADGRQEIVGVFQQMGKTDLVLGALTLMDGQWVDTALPPATGPIDLAIKDIPERLQHFDANRDGLVDFLVFRGNERAPVAVISDKEKGYTVNSKDASFGLGKAGVGSVCFGTLDDQPVTLVAQTSFARNIAWSAKNRWEVLDQYNAVDADTKIAGVVTLDLDGKPGQEIALVDTGAKKIRVLAKKGKLYEPWREVEIGAFAFKSAHAADLNGDGRNDLVLVGPGKFGVLYAGQTDPRLKTLATYESKLEDTSFMDVTAGDLNGDGLLDVAVLDTRSQYIDIATWVPGKGLVHALYFKLFEAKTFNSDEKTGSDPREAAIADVTGDGRQDLILLTHDRVVVYPQDTGE